MTGKKQDQRTNEESNEELREVLLALVEDVLQRAIFSKREGKPDWIIHARDEFSQSIQSLLGQDLIKSQLDDLKNELQVFGENLKSYQHKIDRRVADLLPPGDLKERFESEFPVEKKKIASHVAEQIFSTDRRCFLQASTFLLHLAEVLKETGRGKGSVIHTNSTVFPWLLLGRGAKYYVYTVCGRVHDPLCCGWLFGADDMKAADHVRELFNRKDDPLDLAIVTPQHITLDGRLHFAKEETADLVELLASSARQLVILCPTQRIRNRADDLRNNALLWFPVDLPAARNLVAGEHTTEWILAGSTSDGIDRSEMKQELMKIGKFTHLK